MAFVVGFIMYVLTYIVPFKLLNIPYLVTILAAIGGVTSGVLIAIQKRKPKNNHSKA
ncbi:hypothetical protein [Holzapfeliella sp. JNUCC 72]